MHFFNFCLKVKMCHESNCLLIWIFLTISTKQNMWINVSHKSNLRVQTPRVWTIIWCITFSVQCVVHSVVSYVVYYAEWYKYCSPCAALAFLSSPSPQISCALHSEWEVFSKQHQVWREGGEAIVWIKCTHTTTFRKKRKTFMWIVKSFVLQWKVL